MLPYRRRDFEAQAMIHEILHRAGEACVWGKHFPQGSKASRSKPQTIADSGKLIRSLPSVAVDINAHILGNEQVAGDIMNELQESLSHCQGIALIHSVEHTDCIVVVLSDGVFEPRILSVM